VQYLTRLSYQNCKYKTNRER